MEKCAHCGRTFQAGETVLHVFGSPKGTLTACMNEDCGMETTRQMERDRATTEHPWRDLSDCPRDARPFRYLGGCG